MNLKFYKEITIEEKSVHCEQMLLTAVGTNVKIISEKNQEANR